MTKNITLRHSEQIARAAKVAKATGQKTTQVINLCIDHGLPTVEKLLASLRPVRAKTVH